MVPGKKTRGHKRGIATDVLGPLIAVIVVAASVHDNAIGIAMPDQAAADSPGVVKRWGDAGFQTAVIEHRRLARDHGTLPVSSASWIRRPTTLFKSVTDGLHPRTSAPLRTPQPNPGASKALAPH
ncbi:hypothetical protein [Streptomyces sp. VRA16 Mangrove soil]|uniref:hypothetical protein n=1 Tax=Streptomyces sp. VRA16 Mangrove soil TaxID=2817434 RepID=UPI001A9EC45C|nr:hypothetical protein [Streptomyces sp. VRA16 Mangrove soil]MBO1329794.1 hypothetical protein [Streptomyces sp. VRA16 Mangrove soil]